VADLDIHLALADDGHRDVTLRANTPLGAELLA
jgi:hypothetical protein